MTLKELVFLLCVLAVAATTRLWRLAEPPRMYFDEVYHVPAAMLMAEGDFRAPFDPYLPAYDGEHRLDWLHPPLAKYLQALSMHYGGKQAFFWRLPSVLANLLTLVLFYFLARSLGQRYLFHRHKATERERRSILLAMAGTILWSSEGLLLTMSRLAMNEAVLLFFYVAALLCYVQYLSTRRDLLLVGTGLLLGLALGSKWSAVWLVLLLFLYELGRTRSWRRWPLTLVALIGIPSFVYVCSYLPALWQGMSLLEWGQLQQLIWTSQLHNPSLHPYSSEPLSWPLSWRPVWLHATAVELLPTAWVANIYASSNLLLVGYGLAALWLTLRQLLRERAYAGLNQGLYFLLCLYLAGLLPWMFFTRPLFLYHYLPALPALLILVSYWLVVLVEHLHLARWRRAVWLQVLFWPAWLLLLFYPHWTGWPVPTDFAAAVYFLLANWR